MENKQTAVDWLSERLIRMIPTISPMYKYDIKEYVEQAKAMEKEQIAEAYRKGVEEDVYNNPLKTGNEYYNEQYGK
jgi:primosomal protein N''